MVWSYLQFLKFSPCIPSPPVALCYNGCPYKSPVVENGSNTAPTGLQRWFPINEEQNSSPTSEQDKSITNLYGNCRLLSISEILECGYCPCPSLKNKDCGSNLLVGFPSQVRAQMFLDFKRRDLPSHICIQFASKFSC